MIKVENLTFPNVFQHFYEDFSSNFPRIESLKSTSRLLSTCSVIFSTITLIIVAKFSSRLKKEYRNILFSQLLMAAIGSLIIIFVSPTFLLPYPVLFLTGPLAIDFRITLYLSSVVVMIYFFPTMLLLSFGLVYNFMSLRQLHTQIFHISVDRFLKASILIITLILLTCNFILLTVMADNDQLGMQQMAIQKVDPRLDKIFHEYAVFIFDKLSWPILIASIEALILATASIIFCSVLATLSCYHFEVQKPMLSSGAIRNHRMMMYMLISYLAHFLIFFTLPLFAFTLSIHRSEPIFGSWTFFLLMSPAHLLGVSLSLTYCTIITPYRNVVIGLIIVLTCAHSNNNQLDDLNRPSLTLSTIDITGRRQSYRPNNLPS